jgi:hypothetical protein
MDADISIQRVEIDFSAAVTDTCALPSVTPIDIPAVSLVCVRSGNGLQWCYFEIAEDLPVHRFEAQIG